MRDRYFDYENSTVEQLKVQAAKPDPYAMNALGWHYRNTDKSLSLYWYQKSATLGNAEGLYNLGVRHVNGALGSVNIVEANRLWHLAAAKEHTMAMCNLCISYLHGKGVAKDENKAVRWAELAAYKGEPAAMISLAQLHFYGLGVKVNFIEAAAWYMLTKMKEPQLTQQMIDPSTRLTPSDKLQAQNRASEIHSRIRVTPYLD